MDLLANSGEPSHCRTSWFCHCHRISIKFLCWQDTLKQPSKTWNPSPGPWKWLLYEVWHINSLSGIPYAKHSCCRTFYPIKSFWETIWKHNQHLESQTQHSSSKFYIKCPYLNALLKKSPLYFYLSPHLAVLSTGACPSWYLESAALSCHQLLP